MNIRRLLAEDRRGEAVALFVKSVGVTDKQVEAMQRTPLWNSLTAMAPTLEYDTVALMERYPSIDPTSIQSPTLVMYGSASPDFMAETAAELSQAIPNAMLLRLEGQAHDVKPDVLAPALVAALRGAAVNDDELRHVFDRMASGYDSKLARMAPVNDGLFFLLESVLAGLPQEARILCVGVGTGAEVIHLAGAFPGWRFTAVEPSRAMLDICRKRVDEAGLSSRCSFHEGYLESLPLELTHDAATCFLVSQFILNAQARSDFFRQIADRLVPGGILANTDLSADVESDDYDALLAVWQRVMAPSAVSADELDRMKAGYAKDVAILPPVSVASIIESGGFDTPVQFFQAALLHGWFAKRACRSAV